MRLEAVPALAPWALPEPCLAREAAFATSIARGTRQHPSQESRDPTQRIVVQPARAIEWLCQLAQQAIAQHIVANRAESIGFFEDVSEYQRTGKLVGRPTTALQRRDGRIQRLACLQLTRAGVQARQDFE